MEEHFLRLHRQCTSLSCGRSDRDCGGEREPSLLNRIGRRGGFIATGWQERDGGEWELPLLPPFSTHSWGCGDVARGRKGGNHHCSYPVYCHHQPHHLLPLLHKQVWKSPVNLFLATHTAVELQCCKQMGGEELPIEATDVNFSTITCKGGEAEDKALLLLLPPHVTQVGSCRRKEQEQTCRWVEGRRRIASTTPLPNRSLRSLLVNRSNFQQGLFTGNGKEHLQIQ